MSRKLDWNDLQQLIGKDETAKQLSEGITAILNGGGAANDCATESPAPSDNGGSASSVVSLLDLSGALQRFAWTVPDGRIWDSHDKKMLKEKQVRDWIGPEVYKAWKTSDKRRTVQHSDVARKASAAQKQGSGELGMALRRRGS